MCTVSGLSINSFSLRFPNPHKLKVGSVIQYEEQSGEIKWIGVLPGDENQMAGIEMVSNLFSYECTCTVTF